MKMSLEVQFAFLSREEKVKLYMDMTNSEKIPIARRDRYDNVADTYFDQAREYVAGGLSKFYLPLIVPNKKRKY